MTVIYIIAAMFAASAFLFAISLVPSKSPVTRRLEEMEGVKFGTESGSRAAAFDKLFNDSQRTKLLQQLFEAGWYTVTPAKIGFRIASGFGFGLCLGLGFGAYVGRYDWLFVLLTLVAATCGAYVPYYALKAAIRKRKSDIHRALPDLLDMLSTTVQAGLAFNAALNYATEVTPGALGEEMRAVLSEIRLGRSRSDALRSMAERVRVQEVSTAVTAIVQAERLGSNLSSVLEELAEDTRNKRMLRAEEIAQMMPVKMVIPMALFMLPALFVMIFGGVFAEYFPQ
jgi:tight adherence protein C